MQKRPFYIVSCARSGSTSLSTIFDMTEGCKCLCEPAPSLNVETRLAMDGQLKKTKEVVLNTLVPRIQELADSTTQYGEKQVTLAPFIPAIHKITGANFIFIKRDGRDVVYSLVNWHEQLFGNVYREAHDAGNLSQTAVKAAAQLTLREDTSDFSRPRPLKGQKYYDEWEHFSRFQMCCWYWAFINNLYLDQLDLIPKENWRCIDYTKASATDVQELQIFIGLRPMPLEEVERLLNRKINSLQDRKQSAGTFAHWKNWDDTLRQQFDEIAGPTMVRLGFASGKDYWQESVDEVCP